MLILQNNLTGLDRNNWNDRQDFEDLEQQAFIGIMESIPKYDSKREMKFFSHLLHPKKRV
jgi:DNA-directed RNA polymerase specialized sigma subunit